MVVARWATLAEVIGWSAEGLTLRGLSRARIISAYGDVPPHAAVLEAGDEVPELADLPERIAEAHRLLAALDRGARPSHRAWADELQAAIAALLRAVSDPSAPRRAPHAADSRGAAQAGPGSRDDAGRP